MDESMGSWLGRVAARYRIGVVKLAREQELLLGAAISGWRWMAMAPLDIDAIEQVAWLARVDPDDLLRIQTPAQWLVDLKHYKYCRRCVFLNPFDVTSPRWRLDWLNPGVVACELHGAQLLKVQASMLRQCANMDGVLRLLGKERRDQDLRRGYLT